MAFIADVDVVVVEFVLVVVVVAAVATIFVVAAIADSVVIFAVVFLLLLLAVHQWICVVCSIVPLMIFFAVKSTTILKD